MDNLHALGGLLHGQALVADMERTGIAVHGSTGSIGTQTLDVVKRLRGRLDFDVVALVCNSNIRVMETQILEHRPKYAVVAMRQRLPS
jgi:1-deoxy-D-xylulose 5-phosphate reductoisomerase